MDFIFSILKDFYSCCNVPVKAIDYDLVDIHKIGYDDYFDHIYPSDDIGKQITSFEGSFLNLNLELQNDIYYRIVSISKFNRGRGFFIIGPFRTNIISNKFNTKVLYKPSICANYLSNLILDISDDKFNQGLNRPSSNPYVRKAIEYIHSNYYDEITIESLCNHMDINKCYFCSLFKKYTGTTFSNFLNNFRVEKSKMLLSDTNLSLLDVAVSVGFNNQNYYSTVFKKFANQSPSQYRSLTYLNK
ncbi:AraC family transcriptional regulator [Romboutsia weinsteinii]|uniref:AraC family transcriptional regulator n=1 Tax=Romboutsia weinsteinii TaxID=2020949 RepID=A0A371J8A8_9FIRM|nr:AraC family transcriptional regulator [Romboutsia weinsteinii]RDY28943.1 AraC family transcriptional regulator [Romboutsia weinsteinii]